MLTRSPRLYFPSHSRSCCRPHAEPTPATSTSTSPTHGPHAHTHAHAWRCPVSTGHSLLLRLSLRSTERESWMLLLLLLLPEWTPRYPRSKAKGRLCLLLWSSEGEGLTLTALPAEGGSSPEGRLRRCPERWQAGPDCTCPCPC